MEIYIEEFLIENILINYSILKLIEATSKSKTSIFKLLLSSTIGASFSVFYTVLSVNYITNNLIKIMCAFLMILLAFKSSKKHFIFNFILLFIYTYALGGIVTSFATSISLTSLGLIINSHVSLISICTIIIITTNIFKLVGHNIKKKIKTNHYIYSLYLFLDNNRIQLNAYLDTGNLIRYNDSPVIVIDTQTYTNLVENNILSKINTQIEELKVSTATGSNNLMIIKADTAIIKGTNKDIKIDQPYLAVSNANFGESYQALLSPEMI